MSNIIDEKKWRGMLQLSTELGGWRTVGDVLGVRWDEAAQAFAAGELRVDDDEWIPLEPDAVAGPLLRTPLPQGGGEAAEQLEESKSFRARLIEIVVQYEVRGREASLFIFFLGGE